MSQSRSTLQVHVLMHDLNIHTQNSPLEEEAFVLM